MIDHSTTTTTAAADHSNPVTVAAPSGRFLSSNGWGGEGAGSRSRKQAQDQAIGEPCDHPVSERRVKAHTHSLLSVSNHDLEPPVMPIPVPETL